MIGKVHRLNLSGRAQQPRATAPRAPRKQREPSLPGGRTNGTPSMPTAGATALKPMLRAEAQPRQAALPEPQPVRLVDLAKGGRITILHLSDKTCKWPIGDPGAEDFCFCGHGPRDGSPYCEYHARLAYQPLQDRRNRTDGLRLSGHRPFALSAAEPLVEGIAHAAHGADGVGLAAAAQRLAQAADMDVHGALVDIDVVAPDRIEQLGAANRRGRDSASGVRAGGTRWATE